MKGKRRDHRVRKEGKRNKKGRIKMRKLGN